MPGSNAGRPKDGSTSPVPTPVFADHEHPASLPLSPPSSPLLHTLLSRMMSANSIWSRSSSATPRSSSSSAASPRSRSVSRLELRQGEVGGWRTSFRWWCSMLREVGTQRNARGGEGARWQEKAHGGSSTPCRATPPHP